MGSGTQPYKQNAGQLWVAQLGNTAVSVRIMCTKSWSHWPVFCLVDLSCLMTVRFQEPRLIASYNIGIVGIQLFGANGNPHDPKLKFRVGETNRRIKLSPPSICDVFGCRQRRRTVELLHRSQASRALSPIFSPSLTFLTFIRVVDAAVLRPKNICRIKQNSRNCYIAAMLQLKGIQMRVPRPKVCVAPLAKIGRFGEWLANRWCRLSSALSAWTQRRNSSRWRSCSTRLRVSTVYWPS